MEEEECQGRICEGQFGKSFDGLQEYRVVSSVIDTFFVALFY